MPTPPVVLRPRRACRSWRLALWALALWTALPLQAVLADEHLDEVLFTLRKRDAPVTERHAAAVELVRLQGGRCAGELVDVATEVTTPYALQALLSQQVRDLDADKAQEGLRKLVRDERADVSMRLFALRALAVPADEREGRALLELFESDDALLRREAVLTAVRMDLGLAVPVLERLLKRTRKEDELQPAGGLWLDGLAGLIGDGPEFVERLHAQARSPLPSVRVAAVRLLAERAGEGAAGPDERSQGRLEGRRGDKGESRPEVQADPEREALEALLAVALGDPRRVAPRVAVDAALAAQLHADPRTLTLLEECLASKRWQERHAGVVLARSLPPLLSVDALLDQAEAQSGRLRVEFDEALKALTGQDFQGDFALCAEWWETTGRPALAAPEPESKPRRPRSRLDLNGRGSAVATAATPVFFELSVHSYNVDFVLDISGSMEWPASFSGEVDGPPPARDPDGGPSRMELATQAVGGALQTMGSQARYNLIPFNDRARPWLDRDGMADFGKAGKRTEDALEFLDELSPNDGTNLYGALQTAFQDSEVDSIYLLTDGVPSLGELTEPDLIRRSVLAWNDHREVVLHCVVMGLDEHQHPLARQLAEDSGGLYVQIP